MKDNVIPIAEAAEGDKNAAPPTRKEFDADTCPLGLYVAALPWPVSPSPVKAR